MTTLTIQNPFTGQIVDHDITDLTEAQLDAYAEIMDTEIREDLAAKLAPCTPAEFLAAYVERVGAEEAGSVILGS